MNHNLIFFFFSLSFCGVRHRLLNGAGFLCVYRKQFLNVCFFDLKNRKKQGIMRLLFYEGINIRMIEEKLEELWQRISGYVSNHLLGALLLLLCGWIFIRLVVRLMKKLLGKTKMEQPFVSLAVSVLRTVMLILLFLMTASRLGIDVTGVIALASVLTLAISLSLQTALSNLIGGFTLLNTKPFRIDDYVEIGGQAGTVKQIGLTYTRLLTPDGKTISMPNSTVVAADVVNYTLEGIRRVDISVDVSYNTDTDAVLDALLEAARVEEILPDRTPYVALAEYKDSTIGYILQVWTTADRYWAVKHTIHRNIREVFKSRGVEMTYPHLNIHLEK